MDQLVSANLRRVLPLFSDVVSKRHGSVSLSGASALENNADQKPKMPATIGDFISAIDHTLVGTIEVRTGPMSSGKTDHLITKCSELELQHIPCIILRPQIDSRSAKDHVESATGKKHICYVVEDLTFDGYLEDLKYIIDNAQVIFLDEAQFFGPEIVDFCRAMAFEHKKALFVYGLNGDSDRKVFGHLPLLMPIWTRHVSMLGYCGTCKIGRTAPFTRALVAKKGQVLAGHQGQQYVTQCSECYGK